MIECLENAKNRLIILIIIIVAVAVYANTLTNELFWDDHDNIVNNAYIKDWKYLDRYFSENLIAGAGLVSNYWRPLLLLSFSLDYHAGGLEPFWYHLQSLFWHVLAGILFYLLGYRLFKNKLVALFVSLIFLVHPLQAEAVAYVSDRGDPMQAVFLFASLFLFLKYLKNNNAGHYIFSAVLFALSLLVNERGIIFPGLLFLWMILLLPRERIKTDGLKIIPFFAFALAFAVLRMTVLHFSDTFDPGQPNNIGARDLYEKILALLQAVWTYAKLILWPAKLYMEKSLAIPKSIFDLEALAGLMILAAASAAMAVSARRKKIFLLGAGWFFISLLPAFYAYPIQGFLYEHWLYLPLAGLLWLLGDLLQRHVFDHGSARAKKITAILMIAAIAALGARTVARNHDWRDPVAFYEKNISLGGVSYRVLNNLGMAYAEKKDHAKAIDTYRRAIALGPETAVAFHNMGNSYRELGNRDEALKNYRQALSLDPGFVYSYNALARLYLDENNYPEARSVLESYLPYDQNKTNTYFLLSKIAAKEKNYDAALAYLKTAKNIDPKNIDIDIFISEMKKLLNNQ